MAVAAQNKRKTNHEPNKEDRNKLAIGYRLILGVLVSVFAATAFAADCKVNQDNISDEYVGGCVNGLAEGKGKAKGKDTYEGEFKQGNSHGKGIYTWANGDKYDGQWLNDLKNGRGSYSATDGYKYDGDWLNGKEHGKGITIWSTGSKYVGEKQNGKMHGFGKMTVRRENAKAVESWDGKGKWIGDIYTVEGMFEEGRSTLSCTSPQNCKQEQAKREAQERRDQAARDEQYRRDAPARQARQMCEAQKQTCKASCPAYNYDAKSFDANRTHFQCESRCSQISCN